jgi:hypothetical protein
LAQLSQCSGDLRRKGAFRSKRCIDVGLLAGRCLQQGLRAPKRQLGIAMLRLQLLHRCLVSLNLRLKWGLLKAVKQIALFDLRALHKELLLEERADPGNERHPPDSLDTADELVHLGHLLTLGAHHPDRRRPAGRRLNVGPSRKQPGDKDQKQAPGGPFTSH